VIILLNGAFGIGKTSVARVLVSQLPGAVLYDPEIIGIALQRTARLFGRNVPDFQDLRSWRGLTVVALRIVRLFRKNVIVPMAFSNASHLQEIREGIKPSLHFCLVAPLEVVEQRLQTRTLSAADAAWQFRRAAECCAVHPDAIFATQIDAGHRTVHVIANDIARRITADSHSR
jgi:chloramphenicol 3-O-phosphotransferase